MSDFEKRVAQSFDAYWSTIRELHADAAKSAADAGERYSEELFAASRADDAPERAWTAWSRYERTMAELRYKHWKGLFESQRELAGTLGEVQSEAAEAAHKRYANLLNAATDEAQGTRKSTPKRSSSSGGGS